MSINASSPVRDSLSVQSSWLDDLQTLADRSEGRCFVLMQRSSRKDDLGVALEQLCTIAQLSFHAVELPRIPDALHPYLLAIDLYNSLHWQIVDVLRFMVAKDFEGASMKVGGIQRVCAFVFAQGGVSAVSSMLKNMAIVRAPQSAAYRWLRFYEPINSSFFWPALDEEQIAQAFRGVDSWAHVDPWKSLHIISASKADVATGKTGRLTLTERQWRRLDCVAPVYQAWLRALGNGMPVDRCLFQSVSGAVIAARERGLSSRIDLDFFAWQAFELGPQIIDHPRVVAMIERVDARHDYIGMAYELSAADWQQIATTPYKSSESARSAMS